MILLCLRERDIFVHITKVYFDFEENKKWI